MAAVGRDMSGNGSDSHKRSSKAARSAFAASLPSGSGFGQAGYDAKYGSAIVEGQFLEVLPEIEIGSSQARARRASEGSFLRKDGKRVNGGELRCDTCGKGYKHSSCLTKHLSVALRQHLPHMITFMTFNHP